MPTLLTTRRMSPELARRIRRSVRGREATRGARLAPRAMAVLRFATLALIASSAAWLVFVHRRTNAELERARAEQLARFRREAGPLGKEQRNLPARAKVWLSKATAAYEGDFVAPELRKLETFDATLARQTVYVRGALDGFRNDFAIAESAGASLKDTFVSCLVDPPKTRGEKLFQARARNVLAGAAKVRETTAHVERLQAALVGLPYLAPAWEARLREAENQLELDKLTRAFDHAPLEAAKRAAKSSQLLFVLDEPGDGTGPTELDGERPHQVRVHLVDLESQQLLLRLRRRVDPAWISPGLRAEYAGAIDSCALALDVRESVTGTEPVGAR
jgi:hypothetical protein